jgi:hypothetical protein
VWDSNPPITTTILTENQQIPQSGAPKASPTLSPPVVADDDLRAVLEAWPTLPLAMKAGILAMVKAAATGRTAS